MSDEEMLRSLNLIEKDLITGKEGLTLAAILLFGKDTTILSALPHHKTDAIYRVKNLDRYDDRDDIRTNLIESFDRLMAFIEKHIDDKFYLEGTQRIDVRNKIARELCANLLIHREFSNPYPAKLIIENKQIRTENANRAKMIGKINIDSLIEECMDDDIFLTELSIPCTGASCTYILLKIDSNRLIFEKCLIDNLQYNLL